MQAERQIKKSLEEVYPDLNKMLGKYVDASSGMEKINLSFAFNHNRNYYTQLPNIRLCYLFLEVCFYLHAQTALNI